MGEEEKNLESLKESIIKILTRKDLLKPDFAEDFQISISYQSKYDTFELTISYEDENQMHKSGLYTN